MALTLKFFTILRLKISTLAITSALTSALISGVCFADYGEHYKTDPKWVLVWEQWCKGVSGGVSGEELETVRLISSYISFEQKSGSCRKEQEFLKYNMNYLVLNKREISDFSPLISLLDAKNIETLNIRGTRPTQDELNKLGFLENIPSFKRLFLPYSLENDRYPRCPFERKSICF